MSNNNFNSSTRCPLCFEILEITKSPKPEIPHIHYKLKCKNCNIKKIFTTSGKDIALSLAYSEFKKRFYIPFTCPNCRLELDFTVGEKLFTFTCTQCHISKIISKSDEIQNLVNAYYQLKKEINAPSINECISNVSDLDRPYFREILDFIEHSIDYGKKFLIINAPTGIGKSHVAAALSLYFKSATILTEQKSLQQQYVDEFSWMTQAKGKNNFLCPNLDFTDTCENGYCSGCKFKPSHDDLTILHQSSEQEKIIFNDSSPFSPIDPKYRENLRNISDLPSEKKIVKVFDLLTEDEKLVVENVNSEFLIKYDGYYYFVYFEEKVPPNVEIIRKQENLIFQPKDVCPYYQQKFISDKSSFSVYNYSMYLSNLIARKRRSIFRKTDDNNELDDIDDELDDIDYERNDIDEHDYFSVKRKVLICDEAHRLPDALKHHQDFTVNLNFLSKMIPNFDKEKIKILHENKRFKEIIVELRKISDILHSKMELQQQHSSCIKFLKSRTHIKLHRNESNCMKHEKLWKNCPGCNKISEFVKSGQLLNCVEHLSSPEADDISCNESHMEIHSIKKIENTYSNLSESLDAIDAISKNIKENDESFVITIDGDKLSLEPLMMHKIAHELFENYEYVVFLSSGVDKKFFVEELNLDVSLTSHKAFNNPIPPNRREIFKRYTKDKLNKNFRYSRSPDHLEKYDQQISELSNSIMNILVEHSNEKGIILVNGKDDQKRILSKIKENNPEIFQRITSQKFDSDDEYDSTISNNQALLDEHKIKENSVLFSSSMWYGVSLDGDQGRFCIIATPPFLPSSKPYFSAKKKEESFGVHWIKTTQIFKLIQGCGRCVRSIDDKASTYILDKGTEDIISDLITFTHDNPEFAWMSESIKNYDD